MGYRDIKRNLNQVISNIQSQISVPNQYNANPAFLIDLPKRGFTLRPGLVPKIEDRIIYQAIADFLAPHFIPECSVYSNRLAGNDSSQMFVQGVELWIEFQNTIAEYCQIYPYVVETDITAYFEHIKHDLLLSRISDIFLQEIGQNEFNNIRIMLSRLLSQWCTYGINNFGIPQINDASSFFGNLYLDEVDKWLVSNNMVSLRYVDDICIFASGESQARQALAKLIVKLRQMGLYIASGKTKIKTSVDVLSDLEASRNQVRLIETEIDSREPERLENAGNMLQDFFINLISNPDEFNDRQFRFCINRFKKLHVSGIALNVQEIVIREIINRLSTMPESTDIFIDYLSLLPDNNDVQAQIINFLEGSLNIYAWQEMQLLELLIRSNIHQSLNLRLTQHANAVISSNQHPACRAKAIVLLGKIGSYAERRDIRARYYNEDREDIHRSIITAIQEMRLSERNNFYGDISRDSARISMTTNYIQSLDQPRYHYYNPPSPYDVIPPENDSDDLYDLGSEYFI